MESKQPQAHGSRPRIPRSERLFTVIMVIGSLRPHPGRSVRDGPRCLLIRHSISSVVDPVAQHYGHVTAMHPIRLRAAQYTHSNTSSASRRYKTDLPSRQRNRREGRYVCQPPDPCRHDRRRAGVPRSIRRTDGSTMAVCSPPRRRTNRHASQSPRISTTCCSQAEPRGDLKAR